MCQNPKPTSHLFSISAKVWKKHSYHWINSLWWNFHNIHKHPLFELCKDVSFVFCSHICVLHAVSHFRGYILHRLHSGVDYMTFVPIQRALQMWLTNASFISRILRLHHMDLPWPSIFQSALLPNFFSWAGDGGRTIGGTSCHRWPMRSLPPCFPGSKPASQVVHLSSAWSCLAVCLLRCLLTCYLSCCLLLSTFSFYHSQKLEGRLNSKHCNPVRCCIIWVEAKHLRRGTYSEQQHVGGEKSTVLPFALK